MVTKNNKIDIWVISNVSVFLGQSIDTEMGDSVYWYLNDGSELEIDFDQREIKFIDWVGDTKTYFAIVGLASSKNFTTNDYFTEKK